MLLVPQTAAATCGGCFVLWYACYFPWVLGLTLFTSSGVSFLIFMFSQLVLFKCLPHPLRERAQQFVSFFFFFFFLFQFFFYFLLFLLFPFVSLFHRICMSCLSYPV